MNKSIREIIKSRMKDEGINVPMVAREVGLNYQSIYNYLSGKSEMKSGNLEKIFGLLNISLK